QALTMWKGKDAAFPFIDSHEKTYNVRDNSGWETLKKRLRERIRNSKNIVLFLSTHTMSSPALREEIDYGINDQGLPVIVIYPDYASKAELLFNGDLSLSVKRLWHNLPIFRESMLKVPTLHVPMKKQIIADALRDTGFMLATKKAPNYYWYKL
ncbi:MAG TPA: TIR domain-containing protein, partial [Pyrinomonadaceae bacterium]|nr:TIR domain-containing protein [Pyrinomonadaceae bacterium]